MVATVSGHFRSFQIFGIISGKHLPKIRFPRKQKREVWAVSSSTSEEKVIKIVLLSTKLKHTKYLLTLEYLIAVLPRTFFGDFLWHTLLLDTSRFSKFYYAKKSFFAFWKIGNFFNRLITHVHNSHNENRQKKMKKMFIHIIFGDFLRFFVCNFGFFRKNPQSMLFGWPHDFRFFTIFPQSRLLDAHGYYLDTLE